MTIAELIYELQKYPEDNEVRIESSSGEYAPQDITDFKIPLRTPSTVVIYA